jgi:hypothetical protein
MFSVTMTSKRLGPAELVREASQDVAGPRAKSQADTDFFCARSDRVGHKPHHAQAGDGQRNEAQRADGESATAHVAHTLVEEVLQGVHLGPEIRVDAVGGLRNDRRPALRRTGCPRDECQTAEIGLPGQSIQLDGLRISNGQ